MADKTEAKPNFFPKIGKVADETAKHPGAEVAQAAADDDERQVQEIESLCMKCYQQVRRSQLTCFYSSSSDVEGMTRLLLTSIPFFREVIVMSFRCEHCGFQNNEIQSAGTIRRKCTRP